MGDTLIAGVKDFTLKIGEWTILPEEAGLKHKLLEKTGSTKNWIKRTSKQAGEIEHDEEKAQNCDAENDDHARKINSNSSEDTTEPHKALQENAADLLEQETEEELVESSSKSMTSQKARINLHHKLALALQKLIADLASSPPKQYSYEEWKEYLELISTPNPSEENWDDKRRKSNLSAQDLIEKSRTDWLGEDSPLMASESETEWLVKRLCVRLEECLRGVNDQKDSKGRQGKKNYHQMRCSDCGKNRDQDKAKKESTKLQL